MTIQSSCGRAREALWPDPDTEPAPPDARAHYARCPSCRRFFRLQRQLGRRLAGLPRPAAPERLEARVRTVLARAGAPLARRRRWAWSAVGGLAAAAAVALAVGLDRRTPALVRPLADAAASAELAITTQSPDVVEAWLRRQLEREIELPTIPGAHIRGARLVHIDGDPAAAVMYDLRGLPLVWFALGTGELSGRPIGPEMEIRAFRAGGYEIAVWGEPAGARAVAARMSRDAVLAIAVACRRKAFMQPGVTPAPGPRSPAPYPGIPAG